MNQTNALLWACRTSDTNTYLGANFGPTGVHCLYGFNLSVLGAGRVFVYLKEEL